LTTPPQFYARWNETCKKHDEDRYRVLRTESGPAALDLLRWLQQRNDAVALLLVDHRMPQMNGVEMLQEAIKLYPNAKRTLLTAYADTQEDRDSSVLEPLRDRYGYTSIAVPRPRVAHVSCRRQILRC
jgi:CheY-like chemotaxis protein